MAITRRMVLAGAGLIAGAMAATSAEACSVTARVKPIGFSDAKCRRSLRALIALINTAPTLSDADLSMRAADLRANFDDSVSDPLLNYPNISPIEDVDLIRAWSVSDGKRDRSPVVLHEMNLLKCDRGIALYQFTLRRDQYHPEVTEEEASGSCAGPTEAFYGPEDASYLGVFINNRLREVSAFDAWLRTP